MDAVTRRHIFGRVEVFVYVVEFQKREFSQVNTLIILQKLLIDRLTKRHSFGLGLPPRLRIERYTTS